MYLLLFMEKQNQVRSIGTVVLLFLSLSLSDHLVMLGNHHDAWTFGAADPNSGTAALMDIARVLGDLRNTGKN